jgi:hypothetical protein
MRITASLPDHGAIVEAILEGFVQAACIIIQSGVVPPFPQMTGVKYRAESSGEENWLLPNQVMKAGVGDCEDLSVWLAAGYRVTGQDPYARCLLVMTGDHQLHCIVELQNGQQVDPSAQARAREQQYSVGATRVPRYQGHQDYGSVRDHRGQASTGPALDPSRANAPPAAAPGAAGGYKNPFYVPGLKEYIAAHPERVKDGVLQVTSPTFYNQFGVNTPAAQEARRAAIMDTPYNEAIKSGQQWAADNGATLDIPLNQYGNYGNGTRVEITPDKFGWVEDESGGHVERYPVLPDPAAAMYDPYGGVMDPYGGVYGSSIYGYDPYADPYGQQSYYGAPYPPGMFDNQDYGYGGWQSGPNPQMWTYDELYDTFDARAAEEPLALDAGDDVDNAVDANPVVDENGDAAAMADDIFGGGWL